MVPGLQSRVHRTPEQSGAWLIGTQESGWQQVAATQSESPMHSPAGGWGGAGASIATATIPATKIIMNAANPPML